MSKQRALLKNKTRFALGKTKILKLKPVVLTSKIIVKKVFINKIFM